MNTTLADQTDSLWQPSVERIEQAQITRFQHWLADHCGAPEQGYTELQRWTIEQREDFWRAWWDYAPIIGDAGQAPYLEETPGLFGSRWFAGARLNFAENLLRHRDQQIALVAYDESGLLERVSYADLYDRVRSLVAGLQRLGVGANDVVAGVIGNNVAAVELMLATTALGAIWTSCSPDFGEQALLDRLGQVQPKILIGGSGYRFNGRWFATEDKIMRVMAQLADAQLLWLPSTGDAETGVPTGAIAVDQIRDPEPPPFNWPQLPFDHPVFILYSSGTTGQPKCIVHGAGGALLQHTKELRLHVDVGREAAQPGCLFFYSTCGWMMWNWMVSGLAVGTTLLLYDGCPIPADNPALFWDLLEAEKVTAFGASARYFAAQEKAAIKPKQSHGLASLQCILSTGSPLAPASFDYIYQQVKADVCLASISGGTDLLSCFALGNPTLPVHRGQLQCLGLGMAVAVWDDEGHSVATGDVGELVCLAAFPSMPVRFWNDAEGKRYHQAYFERFEGVWAHGDFARLTEEGGMEILGRSDALLNPGGVRIGTAEIYRVVEQFDEVLEAIAVAQQWQGDQRILLFVRLAAGPVLSDELAAKIKLALKQQASPRHVPALMLAVEDIPRTRSGKLAEIAVRDVIHQRAVGNQAALANPEALAHFTQRPELLP